MSHRAGFLPREKIVPARALPFPVRGVEVHSHAPAFCFPPTASLYKAPAAALGQHTTIADNPDTWARIVEMACARFPGHESAAQAFARFTYDADETAAYAATMDTDDKEQAVLDAARGAAQVRAELWEEASVSVSASASSSAAK
jgi:peptidoglycan/xylan/chitin deacetylase (PgdA/CDA1 family)